MKIFYFSGTGNSLFVAREIAAAFDGAEIEPIIHALKSSEINVDGDICGFVFPIYMNAMPSLVREFVESRDFSACGKVFVVATHGGVPGKTRAQTERVFAGKGIRLWFYEEIEMINNTPKGVAPKVLMHLDWENEITEEKIKEMESRTITGIRSAVEKIRMDIAPEPSAKAGIFSRALWKLSEGSSPKLEFLLDDTCTGCGICEKVCLSGRVRMKNGRPVWPIDSPCFYCYACFNFCPVQAVGVRHYVKKEGRYHYPGIGPDDIAGQK